MTPELETVLQSFLVRKTQEWQQYVREYPELALTSVHIAPDSAWIALEHEEQEVVENNGLFKTGQIIRKSPACATIITKI